MARKAFAGLLLLMLAVLAPTPVVAGPPERPSGRMAFDQVADGLRKYRCQEDPENRIRWLKKLAPTCDVRVAVALGDAWGDRDRTVGSVAADLLAKHFCPKDDELRVHTVASAWGEFSDWWKKNEGDFRRRAKELSR